MFGLDAGVAAVSVAAEVDSPTDMEELVSSATELTPEDGLAPTELVPTVEVSSELSLSSRGDVVKWT